MCGIFGIWHKNGASASQDMLRRATAGLRHRGPDAEGTFVDGPLGMAHTRLKIVDLSDAANQPFTDDSHVLVFNGEIFNAAELRTELEDHHTFITHSDTEVLFAALVAWEENALPRLDGQFAFAFYDRARHRLILARDHAGICPLYLRETDEYLAFCSEIRPLLDLLGPSPLDPQGLMDYFAYRYTIQNGHTLFADIRRFPAASWLDVDIREARTKGLTRYWRLNFADLPPSPAELNDILDSSIRARLFADVPTGLFLSGGVDSRAILHGASPYAAEYGNASSLDAFTLRMSSEHDPDADGIADLQRRYPFTPHELRWNDRVLDTLPDVIRSLEEPFGDFIVCANSLLARETARSLRVVLSGEGGDETFFGYDHQRAFLKMRNMTAIPGMAALARFGVRAAPSSLLRALSGYAGTYGVLEKTHLAGCLQSSASPDTTYLNLIRLFSPSELRGLLSPAFLAHAPDGADESPVRDIFAQESNLVRASMRAEIEQLTLPLNLMKQDRLCMAHSLEARVPLVARSVLEAAASLPPALLAGRPVKQSLQAYSGTKRASKRAFSMFSSPTFFQQTIKLWDTFVSTDAVKSGGLFNARALEQLRHQMLAGSLLGLKRAMAVIVFQVWFAQFRHVIKADEL